MAAKYGVTPWGQWFVEALNSYDLSERLTRGRSYANTGKVSTLKVEGTTVLASVRGSYRPWYQVTIEFPSLEDADIEAVYSLIQEDAMILSRIVQGELPLELLEKLKERNIRLIPEKWTQMKRSCSCPDFGDPCKHQAAVYFILASEIDHDPQVLFRLRGVDLSARFGASVERTLTPPFELSIDESSAKRELPVESYTLPQLENYLGFIQSLLPSSPLFCEKDFRFILIQFQHLAARDCWGVEEPWADEHHYSQAVWSVKLDGKAEPGVTVLLKMQSPYGTELDLSLFTASKLFLSFSSEEGTPSYRFFFWFFRLARAIYLAGAYMPCPMVLKNKLTIVWQPLPQIEQIKTALESLSCYEPGLVKTGGRSKKLLTGKSAVQLLVSSFLGESIRNLNYSPSGGGRAVEELADLFFKGESILIDTPKLKNLPFAIDSWVDVLRLNFSAYHYRLTLSDAGQDPEIEGLPDEVFSDFILSMEVILNDKSMELKDAAKNGNVKVLHAPAVLSNYLPEILQLSKQSYVRLSELRLLDFLDNASVILSKLGVEIVLPKSLHRELHPRLVLSAQSKSGETSLNTYLDLASLLKYSWSISIGDQILSQEDFMHLVNQKKAMVKFRDTYVRLDANEVALLLKKAQTQRKPKVFEILKAHFSDELALSLDAQVIFDRLFEECVFEKPLGLQASLRSYQERGFYWVCSLLRNGFGCILADDMGLGKTIQAITVLLRFYEDGLLENGTLVVVPAALLANWQKELNRFAPGLKVCLYHGTGRKLNAKAQVHLTTYQTAVRDEEKLSERSFSLLIVDEAHLMKNAKTRASITMKSLKTNYRLALSGTPVENRLEDLRSLFDFALPGYLGTAEEFKHEYRIPIEVERKSDQARKLQNITKPFLLRRLKTDKKIISDLPEKIVINEYAHLGKEQAALYESLVQSGLEATENAQAPIERSGLILKMLTGLKQVCDHPRVYDKESPPDAELSGKCGLLLTLLEEILNNHEKVLIFSQYVETLEVLKAVIEKELEENAEVYHGGLSQKARTAGVERFQNEPNCKIFLVSLKAGGLGLNLTAASRVIHFDLWYNPAVENQATDRAFRIGQTKNVFVHRFITTGTFEEKIDAMLTAKRELADMSLSSGESWLTKMSQEELKALFT